MAFGDIAPISVVIPAYNAERYVAEAIASVQAQTLRPSEIIVVDDGSTDATANAVGQIDSVTLVSKANGGPGSARNFGVRHASQPFLAFLDADDLWTPRKLELQFAALLSGRAPAIVFGAAMEFRERDGAGTPVPLADAVPCQLPGALLAARQTIDAVGAFREDRLIGDVIDWYARALDSGLAIETLSEVVLWRRLHATNLGRTGKDPTADYLNVLRAVINRRKGTSA